VTGSDAQMNRIQMLGERRHTWEQREADQRNVEDGCRGQCDPTVMEYLFGHNVIMNGKL